MNSTSESRAGLLTAFLAYLIWGILPVYWKQIIQVPPLEIIMHRVFWACLFALIILTVRRDLGFFRFLKNPRALGITLLCSLLIMLNWYIYIMAVNTGRIVESSMGYYINPLVSVLLGTLFLKESLTRPQKTALLLACAGVLVMTIQYGKFPWISLSLAFTFGLYGYLKKLSPLESLHGQAAETLLLLPVVAVYGFIHLRQGDLHFFTDGTATRLYLVGGGALTLLTLFLFGFGARKIRLSTLGFLQYIAPTLMLLLGVLLYGESFGLWRLLSFLLIWAALILYSLTLLRRDRTLTVPGDSTASEAREPEKTGR